MNNYLTSTVPSDYDLTRSWSCTLGKAEIEAVAYAAIKWLAENGDEWRPVPRSELPRPWASIGPGDTDTLMITDTWLHLLQSVRVPRPGPRQLIECLDAKYGLQYVAPCGRKRAAALEHSEAECASLLSTLRHFMDVT